jgi:hypothetical protein
MRHQQEILNFRRAAAVVQMVEIGEPDPTMTLIT